MSAPRDPEELGVSAEPEHGQIAPSTTVGTVHLTVSDLDRSLDYYRRAV